MTSTQTLHTILLSVKKNTLIIFVTFFFSQLTKAVKLILQQKELPLKVVYTITLTMGTMMHLLLSHPSQNNTCFTCLFIEIIDQLNTACTTFQNANLSCIINRLPNLLDSLVC
jgi:hypothetical protein